MEKLSLSEIQQKLTTVPNWRITEEKWIERKFRFVEYLNGLEFVQRVGELSEKLNHHPFISIDYKLVTLKITSWHAKGLTELDFELAKKCDAIYLAIKK
ncbi:4a-hydroxytetrahydrobiopterin dehydratase [Neobacillus sp. PS3-12]|jgi:4a-hydroxytetrahydrobiopterin dehydratase|uniref:4a-hydroxytetrahydrobiopterin dehydratase n=1 Tax=Neobacillus sp. PS3-12 TaxID=3070677 RepID=UPI0027DF9E49|nr:4a-hydroxytetrahydrobiopterin dehydratase [Neobacillus sp. PS3-12]WML52986.1 4a-hydroxytetrahydrobiopterin dehydratase [Neobacillus sp. PS3-12]